MNDECKRLVGLYEAILNDRQYERIPELYHEVVQTNDTQVGRREMGHADIRALCEGYDQMFPGHRYVVEGACFDGEWLSLRGRVVGETPAFDMAMMAQCRIVDGRIAEAHQLMDTATIQRLMAAAASPGAVASRFLDRVWNHDDDDIIDELFVPDGHAHGLTDANAVLDHDAYKGFVAIARAAIPEMTYEIQHMVEEGDCVVARVRIHGKAATGRPVDFGGMVEAVVRDGKIVFAHNAFDFLTMASQMREEVHDDAIVRLFTGQSITC